MFLEIVDSVEEVVLDDGLKVSIIDNIYLFVLNFCDVCLCVKCFIDNRMEILIVLN